MKLVGNKILFKPFPPAEVTEGGLYVPVTAQEANNKGTIVAVGDKVKSLKEGDVAYRVKSWGEEFIIDGEKHYLMEDSAILAKE